MIRVSILACSAMVIAIAGPLGGVAVGAPSEVCLVCHADSGLAMQKGARTVPLHLDAVRLAASAHGSLGCTDCHAGLDPESVPHASAPRPVDCTGCHGDGAASHPFHVLAAVAEVSGGAGGPAAACKACHGGHEVHRWKEVAQAERETLLAGICRTCHEGEVAAHLSSEHGRAYASGVSVAPSCITCHSKPTVAPNGDADPARRKIAQEKLCLSCHLDDPAVRERMGPTAGFIAAYEASIHGRALLGGNGEAANCVDCHGAHEVHRGGDAASRVARSRIPENCARCHGPIAREYEGSVHGEAFRRGRVEAPVCTDCHGEHDIKRHDDPRAPVAPSNVAAQVCTPCHSSVRLSEKYGLARGRPESFADSYHGLAIRSGSIEAANCASCHTAHDIRPSSDPLSSVAKANLARTCGQCHPGASARFAVGAVHVTLDGATSGGEDEPILYWIATLYTGMILVVVGGMLAHNALDWGRKTARRIRRRPVHRVVESAASEELYLRMSLFERIQHGALAVSFLVLAVTGFMLHYPEAWWVVLIRRVSAGAFELRGLAHRAAGIVMLLAGVAHLFYVAFTVRGRQFLRDILPRRQDVYDTLRQIGWYLGLTRARARFGRFGYVEKSEYWALAWGTVLMGGTGLILWFEDISMDALSKLGWDVARSIHFYEAILAVLAIVVWHLYFVVFNPDVYPMSAAWLTGTLSEEQMEEEHPLELEAIRRERLEAELRRLEERAARPLGDAAGPTGAAGAERGPREPVSGDRDERQAGPGRDAETRAERAGDRGTEAAPRTGPEPDPETGGSPASGSTS